ncbi:helix-turn-helix domain-containing protein [Galactobacter caseinivorans]|uniref:helix-turn-helix domain-containing protein n=1 Tax=Galactobacter caseinivorans TaxID=2676123 RepID=UPI0018F2BC03|nr:helix-turn-helix domain-containing protein [Galactobacter caseinivorans]
MTEISLKAPEARTTSVPAACEGMGISRATGYRLVRSGDFPVRVLKIGKQLRVSITDLNRYLDGGAG